MKVTFHCPAGGFDGHDVGFTKSKTSLDIVPRIDDWVSIDGFLYRVAHVTWYPFIRPPQVYIVVKR